MTQRDGTTPSLRPTDELVREHLWWIRLEARRYYFPGGDHDDVLQEALLGFLSACRTFNGDGDFEGFACMAVRRRLWSAVEAHRRCKHSLLNDSVRVLRSHEGSEIDAVDTAADPAGDPYDVLERRYRLAQTLAAVKALPLAQRSALIRAVNGEPLASKSEDNQRYKARRTLKKLAA